MDNDLEIVDQFETTKLILKNFERMHAQLNQISNQVSPIFFAQAIVTNTFCIIQKKKTGKQKSDVDCNKRRQ